MSEHYNELKTQVEVIDTKLNQYIINQTNITAVLENFRKDMREGFEKLDQRIAGQERAMHEEFASVRKESREQISKLKKEVEQKYVTSKEFEPIKKLAYGSVGVMLTFLIGALLALIAP